MADFSLNDKTVWVAGETGLVGRALVRQLSSRGIRLISAPHKTLDLANQAQTFDWLHTHKPDAIFMAAAKVGGIGANAAYPADFIRDNLAIAQNVIEGAHRAGVQNLLFLGSSCIYPRMAAQPITEDALLTGPLEPTNEAYAIAKIAGLKLCEFYTKQFGRRYFSAMPTNLYGPYDRFDPDNAHVIPAMILKFHNAIQTNALAVTLWGTGKPLREFLHVDDLASACLHLMERYNGQGIVNIGSGEEISIRNLAAMIKDIAGYKGKIIFDETKPDGTPRKLLNSTRMRALGWAPSIPLRTGLEQTYEWFLENEAGLDQRARLAHG